MIPKTHYYYLVSGLPDLILDSQKKVSSCKEFFDEVFDQLSSSDKLVLQAVRFPFDNHNVLTYLLKKDSVFDTRGNFTQEQLQEVIKDEDLQPTYMRLFLQQYREQKSILSDLCIEDQLSWLLYEEMSTHTNRFIREWYEFDLNLRNCLAALQYRSLQKGSFTFSESFSLHRFILLRNAVAEQLLKSTAPDFSLTSELPWLEILLQLNKDDLIEYERGIDMLRWEQVHALTQFSTFTIEALCAYSIKLALIERWIKLDSQTGEKMVQKIYSELLSAAGTT